MLNISWFGNRLSLPRSPELMGVSMICTFLPTLPVCSTASLRWPLLQYSVSRSPLSDKKSSADSKETDFSPATDFTLSMLFVNISESSDALLKMSSQKGSTLSEELGTSILCRGGTSNK